MALLFIVVFNNIQGSSPMLPPYDHARGPKALAAWSTRRD